MPGTREARNQPVRLSGRIYATTYAAVGRHAGANECGGERSGAGRLGLMIRGLRERHAVRVRDETARPCAVRPAYLYFPHFCTTKTDCFYSEKTHVYCQERAQR